MEKKRNFIRPALGCILFGFIVACFSQSCRTNTKAFEKTIITPLNLSGQNQNSETTKSSFNSPSIPFMKGEKHHSETLQDQTKHKAPDTARNAVVDSNALHASNQALYLENENRMIKLIESYKNDLSEANEAILNLKKRSGITQEQKTRAEIQTTQYDTGFYILAGLGIIWITVICVFWWLRKTIVRHRPQLIN